MDLHVTGLGIFNGLVGKSSMQEVHNMILHNSLQCDNFIKQKGDNEFLFLKKKIEFVLLRVFLKYYFTVDLKELSLQIKASLV